MTDARPDKKRTDASALFCHRETKMTDIRLERFEKNDAQRLIGWVDSDRFLTQWGRRLIFGFSLDGNVARRMDRIKN